MKIVVDIDLSNSNQTIIATVLLHELIHLEQHIQDVERRRDLPCVEREIEAFREEWVFISEIMETEDGKYYLTALMTKIAEE